MFYSDTKLVVRYAETDRMGIVHHSNYPIWFEAGRTEFIKMLGMPYSIIEEKGILLPLLELKCEYRGATRYEDEVIVRTYLKTLSMARAVFGYEVYKNGEPDIVTYGETMHAFTTHLLKPVNLRKRLPEVYELLYQAAVHSK